jgi:predicted component of type VI protein secretion system
MSGASKTNAFERSRILSGGRAQMPESKLIEGVPRVVKIASRDVIDTVIGSALPGVVLTHANPPPAPIPGARRFPLFYAR